MPTMNDDGEPATFVSRGGLKLAAALDAFDLDVGGFVCADLGCNVGGFTDCLLQRGASHVYAVDTGYGTFAWKLRQDDRVTVMERSNALHVAVPTERVDLVVIDLGWTKQAHAIPAALRWHPTHIVTLIKPHYEADDAGGRRQGKKGVLDDAEAERVLQRTLEQLSQMPGLELRHHIQSPIRGGKGKGRTGNVEYLAWLEVIDH